MQHTATRRFLGAFLISSALLTLPVAAALFMLAPAAEPQPIKEARARVEGLYQPDRGDSLSLLWILPEAGGGAGLFGLLHADPARGALTLTMLPGDCLMEGEGGLRALKGIYTRHGAEAAAGAVSATAGVHIHRHAVTLPDTLVRIADAAGTVDIVLDSALELPRAGLYLDAGLQRVGGLWLRELVLADIPPGGETERLELIAELLLTLSGRYLEGLGSNQGQRLYTALINALDNTDLSMADYEYRRAAWEAVHETGLRQSLLLPNTAKNTEERLLDRGFIEDINAVHYPSY